MSGFDHTSGHDSFEDQVRKSLYPKVQSSGVFVSLCPADNEPDVKFCVELGAAIMFDKPILAIVPLDYKMPGQLRKVADKVIVADFRTKQGQEHVAAEIAAYIMEQERKEANDGQAGRQEAPSGG